MTTIEVMPDDEFAEMIATHFIGSMMDKLFAPLNDSLKNMLGGVGSRLAEETAHKRRMRFRKS